MYIISLSGDICGNKAVSTFQILISFLNSFIVQGRFD